MAVQKPNGVLTKIAVGVVIGVVSLLLVGMANRVLSNSERLTTLEASIEPKFQVIQVQLKAINEKLEKK